LDAVTPKPKGLLKRHSAPGEQVVEHAVFEQLLEDKLTTWSEPHAETGKSALDYVREQQEADPSLFFRLVATPNRLVEVTGIMAVATTFGEGQPAGQPTWILDRDYDGGRHRFYQEYSAEQLSGPLALDPNTGEPLPVRFSLLPNKPSSALGSHTVVENLATLAELQAQHPAAQLHVPSVWTNIGRWCMMRAEQTAIQPTNTQIQGTDTFEQTVIRHFDLPTKPVGGFQRVPVSFVGDGGRADLSYSFAGYDDVAVVTVG
jgi:hypothetical protein